MTRPIVFAILLAACTTPTPETIQIPVEWVETDVQRCLQPKSQGARGTPDPWGAEDLLILKATVNADGCGCGAVRYVVEVLGAVDGKPSLRTEFPLAGQLDGAMTLQLPGVSTIAPDGKISTYRVELTCSPGF